MSIKDPRIEQIRERWNAMRSRKEREYAVQQGSYLGSSRIAYPFRFVNFIRHIERTERARLRFAGHQERVEYALAAPVTQYIRSLYTAEEILAA